MSHATLSTPVLPSGLRVSRRNTRTCTGSRVRRHHVVTRASEDDTEKDTESMADPVKQDNVPSKQKGLGKGVNLFDPAATMSRAITRRFGFTGGLVFVGLLASVEGREIVGALLEKDTDIENGIEITTDSGLKYVDERIGGGAGPPKKGDFVGVHLLITDAVNGTEYLNTKANKKPVAFIFNKKPLLTPVCQGLEEAVTSMKRGGVRKLTVPANLAYGANGAALANGKNVPPNTDVLISVSIEDISPSYL